MYEISLIFQSFELFIELSVAYRQNTDINFSQLLEHVAYGYITDDDHDTLSTRRCNIRRKTGQIQ